jgi:hypothetical protein
MKLYITIIIGLVFTADPTGKEGVKEGLLGMSMPTSTTNVGMGIPINNQIPNNFYNNPLPNNQFPNNTSPIAYPLPTPNSPIYQI